jgi:hypothetical protein
MAGLNSKFQSVNFVLGIWSLSKRTASHQLGHFLAWRPASLAREPMTDAHAKSREHFELWSLSKHILYHQLVYFFAKSARALT